ncbi:MAG: 30S ribosome-binding factor RbfA [Actinomycetota bacterium]
MARSSGRRGGGGDRRRAARPPTNRHYPRTARLNNLLQRIVADYLERVDDERLGFLTVTGVEVDSDLNRAEVFVSALDRAPDPEADEAYLEVLAEYRKAIQSEINAQARIRKTPEVVFAFDPGVRAGARIEEILAGLDPVTEPETENDAEAEPETPSDAETDAEAQGDAETDVDAPTEDA